MQVKAVVVYSVHGCVSFDLDTNSPGSRYCVNVGRCHRHNFAFWVADFSMGVYYQKCWDEGCKAQKVSPCKINDTRSELCLAQIDSL